MVSEVKQTGSQPGYYQDRLEGALFRAGAAVQPRHAIATYTNPAAATAIK